MNADTPAHQTYRITFGKYRGHLLRDVPAADLRRYIAWLETEAASKSVPLSVEVTIFVNNARKHLDAVEGVK